MSFNKRSFENMKKAMRRFIRLFKIRMVKNKMYNLECDMMFFAIPFQQYLKEKEAYEKELENLSNGE